MAALIQEEQLDEDGQPAKVSSKQRRLQAKQKVKKNKPMVSNADEVDDDDDNRVFSASDSDQTSNRSSQSETESSDRDIETISNDEVRSVNAASHRRII
jgi:hypothetical protein